MPTDGVPLREQTYGDGNMIEARVPFVASHHLGQRVGQLRGGCVPPALRQPCAPQKSLPQLQHQCHLARICPLTRKQRATLVPTKFHAISAHTSWRPYRATSLRIS